MPHKGVSVASTIPFGSPGTVESVRIKTEYIPGSHSSSIQTTCFLVP
jgi:hypothetical protein